MGRKGYSIGDAHRFPTVEIDDIGILEFLGRDAPERARENPLVVTVGQLD